MNLSHCYVSINKWFHEKPTNLNVVCTTTSHEPLSTSVMDRYRADIPIPILIPGIRNGSTILVSGIGVLKIKMGYLSITTSNLDNQATFYYKMWVAQVSLKDLQNKRNYSSRQPHMHDVVPIVGWDKIWFLLPAYIKACTDCERVQLAWQVFNFDLTLRSRLFYQFFSYICLFGEW